jgi:hypothetical protein
MAYWLISERGNRVAHFSDPRKAKIHQCLAFVRGIEYSIEHEPCEAGCSFPQCYAPCKHCSSHIKPMERQFDEAIFQGEQQCLAANQNSQSTQ